MSIQDDFARRAALKNHKAASSSKVFSLLITLFILGFLMVLVIYYSRNHQGQDGNIEGWQNREGVPQNLPNTPPKITDDVANYGFRERFDQNYQTPKGVRYTEAGTNPNPPNAQSASQVKYMVQAGAFSNPVQAEARLRQLRVAGYADAKAKPSAGVTRIILGPYSSHNEAQNVMGALEVLQIDSMVATYKE